MSGRQLPLAVDLGTTRVRVVSAVQARDGRLRVRGFGRADIDSDVPSALRRAVKDAGGRERRCLLMVPAAEAPLRTVRLPAMPARERRRALEFEARIESRDEKVIVRSEDRPDGRTVVSAVAEGVLAGLVRPAVQAGLKPVFVSHQAIVLGEAGDDAVLDIGFARSTLVVRDGSAASVRVLACAGENFTTAIAQAYRIERCSAQARKHGVGLAGLEANAFAPFLDALHRAIQSLRGDEGLSVRGLRLCGNGARLAGLADAIRRDLAVEVSFARLDDLAPFEGDAPPDRATACDLFATVALAVAGAGI